MDCNPNYNSKSRFLSEKNRWWAEPQSLKDRFPQQYIFLQECTTSRECRFRVEPTDQWLDPGGQTSTQHENCVCTIKYFPESFGKCMCSMAEILMWGGKFLEDGKFEKTCLKRQCKILCNLQGFCKRCTWVSQQKQWSGYLNPAMGGGGRTDKKLLLLKCLI